MNKISKNCTELVANCDQNKIPLGTYCYPFSYNNKKNNTTFTSQDRMVTGSINSISETSLPECAYDCYANSNCGAFAFMSEQNTQDGFIPTTTGTCYQFDNNYSLIQQPLQGFSNQCASVYTKNIGTDNGLSIVSLDNESLDIDLDNKVLTEQLPKIQTTYSGSPCRAELAGTSLTDPDSDQVIQDMVNWCEKNRDKQVCNEFCNNIYYNEYCTWQNKSNIPIYISFVLFLISVFILIYFARSNKKIYTILTTCFIFAIIIYVIVFYIKKNRTDSQNKPDYTPWFSKDFSNCQDSTCKNGCANYLEKCRCQNTSMLYGDSYELHLNYKPQNCNKPQHYVIEGGILGELNEAQFVVGDPTKDVFTSGILEIYDKNGSAIKFPTQVYSGDLVTLKYNGTWLTVSQNVIDYKNSIEHEPDDYKYNTIANGDVNNRAVFQIMNTDSKKHNLEIGDTFTILYNNTTGWIADVYDYSANKDGVTPGNPGFNNTFIHFDCTTNDCNCTYADITVDNYKYEVGGPAILTCKKKT